ncbi:hypothetical protein BP5796_00325 [Coleophoma crateriformis]|uniref:Carboxypeptidase S1 n=1 Tax=Coleophoma crateriformis TaxID=565419 RepID=A0A3D8T7K0_9HELO|nr:hypothetical protein BP5796_00325 [Coleophoma crateriformis]
MWPTKSISLLPLCISLAFALPPEPKGVTTIPLNDTHGTSLSFKETHICETTPGTKAYAGYVNLPSTLTGENFNISTFYWFFQARKSPENASTAIYLAGGPGESSLLAVMGEGGPCLISDDYNTTTLNPWSWNNEVNMLYIDQPVQTGFSYDTLINGTYDLLQSVYTPMDFSDGFPDTNLTYRTGTFPSQNTSSITQGSGRGAHALWHFMQVWTAHFPKKTPKNDKISIWANSWGGFYSTFSFSYFARQNELIRQQERDNGTSSLGHVLDLDVLGITNGCVDPMLEALYYPEAAIHNPYGFKAYSDATYEEVIQNFTKPNGCRDLADQCHEIAAVGDPNYDGNNQTVNEVCSGAFEFCFGYVQGTYVNLANRSSFDMSAPVLDPFPDYKAAEFFNQAWVQSELGVPLNFTAESSVAGIVYLTVVGDAVRSNISNLEYILNQGYKVAMVFGDRDYRCNWMGAENVTLTADWQHADTFTEAGYANIVTNASYVGGLVRQAGSFSFSRVFQAGHKVMSFQPETVYRIFQRAMSGSDVATGTVTVGTPKHGPGYRSGVYHTTGPLDVRNVTEVMPPLPALDCDIWDPVHRCSDQQIEAIMDGTAVLVGAKVVEPAS